MTSNNNKLRAVFLAAIMFMWLFAGTVAFAGSAGAQFNGEEGDDPWASGEEAFQGQQLYFEAADDTDDATYRVHEVDGDSLSASRYTFTLSEGDFEIIDTSPLAEGDHVISKDGSSNIVVTDEFGVEESVGDDVDAAAITIVEQAFSADFAADTVPLEGTTTLELSSANRPGTFDIEVGSDNLSQTELENIFEGASALDDDLVLIEDVSRAEGINATFSEDDVDAGDEYTFDVDVADTTASDTASISIGEVVDDAAAFGQAQYNQERGDIVTFDLEVDGVDTVNVSFGGDDINYQADLEVTPNDDGEVVIQMNTWLASRTGGEAINDTTLDSEDVFTASAGTIESVSESTTTRNRVLDAGLYDLVAEETTDEEPIEYDVAVVNLNEPSLDEIRIHTSPTNGFNAMAGDQEAIYAALDAGQITEADEIAINLDRDAQPVRGDGIVHAIDVSGVYGVFDAADADSDAEALGAALEAGLFSLEIEQTNPGPNEDPKELEGLDGFQVVTDSANDTVFVNVRSDSLNLTEGAELGDEYDVTFTAEPEFLNQFLRSANQVEEGEDVTDSFELVDREAEFDTTDVDGEDVVLVPAEEGAEVTGATNVAPGTEMTVRTRATGESPFLMSDRVTVESDGTFSAEFDFSGISDGQEFTASIQRQSFAGDASTPGLVGDVEEETPTPTPTPEEDDDDPTPTPEEDDDDPTPTPEEDDDDPPEDDTDDQAGFGAVVALIALLAAALIAARRHSLDN